MLLLSIDPGPVQSAYCLMEEEGYFPRMFGKVENDVLLRMILGVSDLNRIDAAAIEMVASYGMPVGAEVFDTCVWIGRFTQAILSSTHITPERVFRIEEKMALCRSPNAKDSNIRQALIDRFARFDFKNGKGTKKNPDFFYGFSKDVWSAFAVGVTFIDRKEKRNDTDP